MPFHEITWLAKNLPVLGSLDDKSQSAGVSFLTTRRFAQEPDDFKDASMCSRKGWIGNSHPRIDWFKILDIASLK